MRTTRRSALGACLLCTVPVVTGCVAADGGRAAEGAGDDWVWTLPPEVSPPLIPPDNPMSAARVELGRALFYDTRLSVDGTMSCGGCHQAAHGFGDDTATSPGVDGLDGARNAMPLANVAFQPALTWSNPVLTTLEQQALVPLFLDVPLELGAQFVIEDVLASMRSNDTDRRAFARAFPGDAGPVTIANITRAIAAFERTMLSFDSPWDRWMRGDDDAMTPQQQRGFALFSSDRLGCTGCHDGILLGGPARTAQAQQALPTFANTGLYNLEPHGGYPPPNTGLHEFSHQPGDMGRFRVPSLRNIEVSAPYMHDGSVATLDLVLDHYQRGGRELAGGAHAGDGALNPHKDDRIRGFELSDAEREDLLAFFAALTDRGFLENPALHPP
jgi:cytochrome c peroxidase